MGILIGASETVSASVGRPKTQENVARATERERVQNKAKEKMLAFYTDSSNQHWISKFDQRSNELWAAIFTWFFEKEPGGDDDPLWEVLLAEYKAGDAQTWAISQLSKK